TSSECRTLPHRYLHKDDRYRLVTRPVQRGLRRTDAPGYHLGELVTPEYDVLPVKRDPPARWWPWSISWRRRTCARSLGRAAGWRHVLLLRDRPARPRGPGQLGAVFMRFRQCITALSDATREDLGCGPAPRSRTRQSSPIRILL